MEVVFDFMEMGFTKFLDEGGKSLIKKNPVVNLIIKFVFMMIPFIRDVIELIF